MDASPEHHPRELRVGALVVTRDRRRLLGECLQALAGQTHPVAEVLVYDNASSDGTAEWLASDERSAGVRVVRSEQNLGGAGGFAAGVLACRELDLDWLLLMDDDAAPEPDALERLLADRAATDPATVALCASVVHPDGTIDRQHRCAMGRFVVPLPESAYAPGAACDVDLASFVGLLVRGEALLRTDPPRAEFFLGYDDAEWSLRLRRSGRIRLVPGSVVVHKVPIGGGQRTRRARLWNRVLGQEYGSTPWPAYWKELYRIRNVVALQRAHGGARRADLGVLVAGYVVKALLYDRRPWRRIPWLVRYAVKGWRGDFRAPSPDQWRRRASSSA